MIAGMTQAVFDRFVANEEPFHFVRLELNGGTVRLTDFDYELSWGGHTWLADYLLDPSKLDRQSQLRTSSDAIVLSGVEQTLKAQFLNDPARQANTRVTIYQFFVDDDGEIVPDPIVRDIYRIDSISPEVGLDVDAIAVRLAGEFADFDYKAGIRTTKNSLQRFHPDDGLFNYSKSIKKDIKWGGK